ncbi:sensor domain-containing protein [[Mycobacterium] nativiensis]|uniref:Sensor domain-containing protein n=1 Tax=[Mycobacterium] nativiensis TaxID=2855503 RepID=A0ABU5Y423_9MYCO|nr:sensor domain-containing protein [Mycolicibacter sp. MYC340]MEB3034903.1 sensor domain-containing protein [Mycolicibacter sp. MYC340]
MSRSEQPKAAKSKRPRLLLAIGVAALAVVGLVTWLVLPNRSQSASGGITGEAVKQILLDGTELTAMLDQPFTTVTGPPAYGGLEAMDDSSAAGECVGVVDVAPKSVYESADVRSYARETWIDSEPKGNGFKPLNTRVMFVKEAVVALPSAADAQALFAKFAEQWKACDGQPVNTADPNSDGSPPLRGTEMHITDVRVTDDVLAASIVLDKSPKAPDTRAIGVQGNCIVGVLIAFTGTENATGSGDPQTSSIEAVQAMMDKASKLG